MRGPQYRPQYTIILIMGTRKRVPLILGNPYFKVQNLHAEQSWEHAQLHTEASDLGARDKLYACTTFQASPCDYEHTSNTGSGGDSAAAGACLASVWPENCISIVGVASARKSLFRAGTYRLCAFQEQPSLQTACFTQTGCPRASPPPSGCYYVWRTEMHRDV